MAAATAAAVAATTGPVPNRQDAATPGQTQQHAAAVGAALAAVSAQAPQHAAAALAQSPAGPPAVTANAAADTGAAAGAHTANPRNAEASRSAAAGGAPVAPAAAQPDAAANAAAAAAGSAPAGDPPLRVAERHLLQLYKAHVNPSRQQLLRFRQAMWQLGQVEAGNEKLNNFWADYEWVTTVAGDADMELEDWEDAFNTLVENALKQ